MVELFRDGADMPAEADVRADAALIAPARIGAALGAALAAQDGLGVRALGMLRDARRFLTAPQGLEYPAAHAVASCRMAIDFLLQLSKMTTGPGLQSAARAVLGDVDALLASTDSESDAHDPTRPRRPSRSCGSHARTWPENSACPAASTTAAPRRSWKPPWASP